MPRRVLDLVKDGNTVLSETLKNLKGYGGSNIPAEGISKVSCGQEQQQIRNKVLYGGKQQQDCNKFKGMSVTEFDSEVLPEIKSEKVIKNNEKNDEVEGKVQKIAAESGQELKKTIISKS